MTYDRKLWLEYHINYYQPILTPLISKYYSEINPCCEYYHKKCLDPQLAIIIATLLILLIQSESIKLLTLIMLV